MPNITIQILSLNSALGRGFLAPFEMPDYPRPVGSPGIAWMEHLTRTQYLDKPDEIADCRTAWQRVAGAAVDPAASARFIEAIADSRTPSWSKSRMCHQPTWRKPTGGLLAETFAGVESRHRLQRPS